MSTGSTSTRRKWFSGNYIFSFGKEVELKNRYLQWATRQAFRATSPKSAEISLPEMMQVTAPTANWLPSVEARIENSIIPEEYAEPDTSEFLSERVGNTALNFFKNSSDLLPGEPYIYASRNGSLVAEFEGPNGTMTTVISPDAVLLLATVDGEIYEEILKRGCNRVREELSSFKKLVVDGADGKMESAK